MSPASKFWFAFLIGFLIMLGIISSPWFPIILYIVYSIFAVLIFAGDLQGNNTDKEIRFVAMRPGYRFSLFIGIVLFINGFNKFINNKFKKND